MSFIMDFADAIKNCMLLILHSCNGIKEEDTKPLADAIKQCSTLDISLHCNSAKTLCSALKCCSNLHIYLISVSII